MAFDMAIKTSSGRGSFDVEFPDFSNRTRRTAKSLALRIPDQIEVQADRLIWAPPISWRAVIIGRTRGIPVPTPVRSEQLIVPSDRMLFSFLKLAFEKSPKPFLEFAQRYGVFGAVQLPRKAPRRPTDIWFEGEPWRVSEDEAYSAPPWPPGEPIGLWRHISRAALAMLRIAKDLKPPTPRLANAEEWAAMLPGQDPDGDKLEVPYNVAMGRLRLLTVTNSWLERGRVGLRIEPEPLTDWARTEVVVHYGGYYNLLGAIATYLMLEIYCEGALYICSGCKLPYISPRRPKMGLNNYCGDCGPDKRALYDADRRRKDKMIEARRLRAEGVPLPKIARRLDTKLASVRRWVGKGKQRKRARLGS